MKLKQFVESRDDQWREIESLLKEAGTRPERLRPASIRRLGGLYRRVAADLQGVPGLTAEVVTNTAGYEDVEITWDSEIIPLTTEQAKEALMEGEPRLAYLMTIRTRLLRDGEEVLVARRLRDFFVAAGAA